MTGALLIATQFNSSFYMASVTVIPIFFITLAVELGAARSPVMQRMVALYRYRKLRRFESIRDRMHWLFRGLSVLLTALLPIVTVLGWAAEVTALLALNRRAISQPAHLLVLVGVIALPTVTLFWALAMREREPTSFEDELDRITEQRDQAIAAFGRPRALYGSRRLLRSASQLTSRTSNVETAGHPHTPEQTTP
jgi:hypothetical protein